MVTNGILAATNVAVAFISPFALLNLVAGGGSAGVAVTMKKTKEKLEEVRSDLEDRFGKLNEDIIIYMYEEWFEKLVKQVGVTKVSETKNTIELYFNKDATSKLNTEDLFMNAYTITPMFRFKSRESDLTIILDIVKLEKHPIYYLVALLSSMVS